MSVRAMVVFRDAAGKAEGEADESGRPFYRVELMVDGKCVHVCHRSDEHKVAMMELAAVVINALSRGGGAAK